MTVSWTWWVILSNWEMAMALSSSRNRYLGLAATLSSRISMEMGIWMWRSRPKTVNPRHFLLKTA